ncbi:cob(I)yrinic acid a,c-diamide adenosyltransferase [Desulfovibrio litoralis]|uniref:corrinoid adenosyltransferase n=1 Tax=Desulfovibrio litoralis DSM 11393 TaxID=1121455 RepID=A0A1M7SZ95_9BACT|nr:cob(I)yrinic acid a,c-diamide adenosyltransferase [Desulfovibrio litoralis]SHN63756.1 cob(I)yrinic acid a,c-diamide adenosyltransferase [Desulfovibrio litoralis DSM 11393]
MLIIYTGNGKGKTSACVGQAIRAYGHGFKVAFAQFMKRSVDAGEQMFLKELLKDNFIAGGMGFFYTNKKISQDTKNKHHDAAKDVLNWAKQHLETINMLILDEAIYALGANLISKAELEEIIELCTAKQVHLVLSGRNTPDWLIEKADLVSSIEELKHPYQKGIKAQQGIEF